MQYISGTIANILNLGSLTSNINITGVRNFNTYLPQTTITTGFNSNNFTTKLYNDSIYLTSSTASTTYQPITTMSN